MKKQLLSFLCLSLLAASITGCVGEETAPNKTETQNETQIITEDIIPLPEADYNKANVKILTAAEQWQDFYIADQTGDAINDSVYQRNRTVEERYNVTLDYLVYNGYNAGRESVRTALTGSVMGGTAEFDLMVGGVSYITPYILENLYTDLYTLDTLQFDKPWWFTDIHRELEIGGHLYLGSGYYGMLTMADAVVTFFNKQVAEDYGIEDLYSHVDNGTWTFDKMVEFGQIVSADLNGDGKYIAGDRFGVMSTNDEMSFLVNSMGCFYTERTSDGTVLLRDPSEKFLDIIDKLSSLRNDNIFLDGYDPTQLGQKTSSADEIYGHLLNYFAGNQALFLVHKLEFCTRETLRNMEKYGILPTPKYDEQQENYITSVSNDVAAIPSVVTDTEMSSTLLEALEYYTYDIVRPQYYEIALKRKGTRDNASEKMLDLILEHVSSDFTYMFLSVVGDSLFYGCFNPNYTSWAAKNYQTFRVNIDNIVKAVQDFSIVSD